MAHPKYDNIVFADFESYFSVKDNYSLTKMTTIEYVRDPRWITLGCAVAMNGEPSQYLTGDALQAWFDAINWSRTAFCAFNCLFDGTVMTQRFNIFPAYYICTLSVCRALLPIDRHNLKTVAPLLGLKEKLDALVSGSKVNTVGMEVYANRDNDLNRDIYLMLYPMLSVTEQDIISLTIRGGVEPTLVLDRAVLVQVKDDAVASREAAIAASGYPEDQLTSNPKFAKIIKSLGLTCPVKLSETTGEETEAFAKGDSEFVAFMLEHPQYIHIWKGRLAAKSNINITRAEKFLRICDSSPDHTTSMPLNYCGAHTGRDSGADGMNVQNLPNKYKSNMRKAFTAPEGHVVVAIDSAQIELRVNFWQTGQLDKLDILRNGGCVYTAEAMTQFGIYSDEIPKKGMVTDEQRQYGKLCQLGLGFGMGALKFRMTAAAGPLGQAPIYMTQEEAYDTVTKYRHNNECIPAFWQKLNERIHQMTLPGLREVQGVVTFVHEGIELPSGRMLQYPGLMQTEDGQWVYGIDKKTKFIWGGTMCFTANTRCVTLRGIVPITEVTNDDLVWDGEEWVTTDGVVAKGNKEVGSWLGVTVTAEHKIFDGSKWRRVMDLDASSSQTALDWARSSANSRLPTLELGTTVLQTAFASAENQKRLILEPSQERKDSCANDVLPVMSATGSPSSLKYSLTERSPQHGSTGTQGWLADALTQATQRIKTMGGGASQYATNGSTTAKLSFAMLRHSIVSMLRGLTSTERTTNVGTSLGISDYVAELTTPITGEAANLLNTKGCNTLTVNLESGSCPTGRPQTLSITTSPEAGHSTGLWKSMTGERKVFDLVNCGKNHRFTIMTTNGPVVVHNCENLTQALARDIVFEQMLKIDERYRVVSSTHDEVLIVAKTEEAEEALAWCVEIMSTSPEWAPDLPVSAEGGYAKAYSK